MWNEFASFLKSLPAPAKIWWRDDDAVSDSVALQNYLHAMGGMPLLLAVIADKFDDSLVQAVADKPHIRIAQHGFRHANHAPPPQKKNEYPNSRDLAEVLAEWKQGKERLQAKFGGQFMPVFVPAWNRLGDKFMPFLSEAGFCGVSLFGGGETVTGLQRCDTHVDIIDWRHGKKFIGGAAVLQLLMAALATGQAVGMLTHHLVHCEECNGFLLEMGAFLRDNKTMIEVLPSPFKEPPPEE